jgi:hypothetical protein
MNALAISLKIIIVAFKIQILQCQFKSILKIGANFGNTSQKYLIFNAFGWI